jgi:hypothetical protein
MAENKTEYLPIVARVEAAIKEFEATQKKHKNAGAFDTEPDGVWQGLLLNAIDGKAPTPPRSPEKWQLLTLSCDCTEAANDLFAAALKTIQIIESCSIRDMETLRQVVDKYCWRYR